MKVNLISIPKEIAKKEYEEYSQAVKSGRKDDYLEEMKQLNKYLSQGKQIINIFNAFQEVGLNHLQQPKLAVCSATAKECFFSKTRNGGGAFRAYNNDWGVPKAQTKLSVILPEKTYQDWETVRSLNRFSTQRKFNTNIKDAVLSTPVPIIPARLLPPYGLHNYHIIWEVNQWQVRRAPVDPILAKRISKNLFAVLAVWDLSPLEQALVEGRVAS